MGADRLGSVREELLKQLGEPLVGHPWGDIVLLDVDEFSLAWANDIHSRRPVMRHGVASCGCWPEPRLLMHV
jgi:hypothetical protein